MTGQIDLLPGTWGVSHGSGYLGDMIRNVEQATSKSARFPAGDHVAAWAGHVFGYAGNGQIVQAEWPKVTLSPVTAHSDAIWAVRQPLTDTQRAEGRAAFTALVGAPYDVLAYAHYLAMLAGVTEPAGLSALSAVEAAAGPICSGVMIREQEAMGVDLGPLKTAATQNPDWDSPADCLRWGLDNGWMHREVPSW